MIEKNIHKNPNNKNDSKDYAGIEQLHELMKKGILTEEEFEKKKKKLFSIEP